MAAFLESCKVQALRTGLCCHSSTAHPEAPRGGARANAPAKPESGSTLSGATLGVLNVRDTEYRPVSRWVFWFSARVPRVCRILSSKRILTAESVFVIVVSKMLHCKVVIHPPARSNSNAIENGKKERIPPRAKAQFHTAARSISASLIHHLYFQLAF